MIWLLINEVSDKNTEFKYKLMELSTGSKNWSRFSNTRGRDIENQLNEGLLDRADGMYSQKSSLIHYLRGNNI